MTTPVQVLTAGGAATKKQTNKSKKRNSPNRRRPRKNNRNQESEQQQNDSLAAAPREPVKSAEQPVSQDSLPSVTKKSTPKERQNPTPPPMQEDDDIMLLDGDERNSGGAEEDEVAGAPTNEHEGVLVAGGADAFAGENEAKTLEPALSPSMVSTSSIDEHHSPSRTDLIWLLFCFLGIMMSFVCYGLLLEYTTSGGRQLHELSFLFVTSSLYTVTAAAGRYVRDETPTSIPPARFAILGLTSMGSTFCSVRSLRYVIYPIQVLAKSCKPVPVMIMGALMGKKYPLKKYLNVVMIVLGVALFMGGGDKTRKPNEDNTGSASQIMGILLLFVSLCFDGGTGAYEDKLMSVHSVGPFDLMYNIQLGKTILAGIGLIVLNQVHIFVQMCQEMGLLLVALGLSGALGQVFIFVTIAKFGALTCSIIGLARKVTTLVASIYFYGHHLNPVQFFGLVVSVGAMVMNFWGKKGGGGHHHGPPPSTSPPPEEEEMEKMLGAFHEDEAGRDGDVELANVNEKAAFV